MGYWHFQHLMYLYNVSPKLMIVLLPDFFVNFIYILKVLLYICMFVSFIFYVRSVFINFSKGYV